VIASVKFSYQQCTNNYVVYILQVVYQCKNNNELPAGDFETQKLSSDTIKITFND
jgi:hypothetical protein